MSQRGELKRWLRRLLVALLLPGLTGCLTSKLWEGGDDRSYLNRPSTNSPPALFQTKDGTDVLVSYVECRDKDSVTKQRAYLLYQNRRAIEGNRKPDFLNPAITNKFVPIPLTRGTFNDVDPADETLRAFVDDDGQHFTLVSKAKAIGTYTLPVYSTSGSNAKRVFLTPLAVTGDVVIVGVAVGSVFGVVWFICACAEGKTIDTHWKP